MNEVFAWIAVDKSSYEYIHEVNPVRYHNKGEWHSLRKYVLVPKGTAEKLTGSPMTWDDEPRELK